MADGVVIQEAATRALRNGMSLRLLFQQLTDIRRDVHIPLVLMGYLNPILQFGFEHFCQECVRCGIDGVIIPDLPFREYEEHYKALAEQYGIKVIMLITPETSEERIREIDAHTDGFIYMVCRQASVFPEDKRHEPPQPEDDWFRHQQPADLRSGVCQRFGCHRGQPFRDLAE